MTTTRNIKLMPNGLWGVDVYFGAQLLRRSYYATRATARNAECSDGPGDRGCVALTREGAGYQDATIQRVVVELRDCLVQARRQGWIGRDREYDYTEADLESVHSAIDCTGEDIGEAIRHLLIEGPAEETQCERER